jgi:hypothetical protein
MLPIEVIKLGSSAFDSVADPPPAIDETYRRLRLGRRLLVVVSTQSGAIDASG